MHRVQWTNFSIISPAQHTDLGCSKASFKGFSNIPHIPPPSLYRTPRGHDRVPDLRYAPCWRVSRYPREICNSPHLSLYPVAQWYMT